MEMVRITALLLLLLLSKAVPLMMLVQLMQGVSRQLELCPSDRLLMLLLALGRR